MSSDQAGSTRSTEATMSCGRPSQKLTKWARRKRDRIMRMARRIDSHVAIARSSSPSDHAVSAAM
jgi:hypothetical protein